MRGRLPAKYKWDDTWLTAKEIAELENIPVNCIRMYFSRCKGDAQCVKEIIARRGEPRGGFIKYPYRDGRMLSVSEIMKLEPHMASWKIRYRYKFCDPGDWDKIFSKKRLKTLARNEADIIDCDAIGEGLGPRKNIMDIQGPSDYEQQLWTG